MKKWLLIFIIAVLLLSGCALKKSSLTEEKDFTFALGYRPLPEEFLKWWFENRVSKSPSQLPIFHDEISETQVLITSPVLDPASLPWKYDMRGLGLVTPPKNQGSNGTCWAFATIGALESAMLTQLGPIEIADRWPFVNPYSPDLSEQFLAYYNVDFEVSPNPWGDGWSLTWQETNKDMGGSAFFSTYTLIRRGVPLEEDIPYIGDDYEWIAWNAYGDEWKYHLVRSNSTIVIPSYYLFYDRENYLNTIKSVLKSYGALFVSFTVYEDFYDYWHYWPWYGEVFQHSYGDFSGGHAVLLVGWDDYYYDEYSGYYGPVWILKNSWGTENADGGCFYLPMITDDEFYGICPGWKIESSYMYVPIL